MTSLHLTQSVCNRAIPGDKRYDLRDSFVRGLFLRVEVSGRKTWYLCYRTPSPERRLRNKKLVSAAVVPLEAARRVARDCLAKLFLEGVDPADLLSRRRRAEGLTLGALIEAYEPWVCSHQKSGDVTIRMLRLFTEFMDMPAAALDKAAVERWRTENLGRIRRATINRRVAALQALCAWGVKQGLIEGTPFKLHRLPQTDSRTVTRFLTKDERERLMCELTARENRLGRDYLKPAVILSLNTGIRKGTLLGLKWEDVDFNSRTLTLRAAIMKGGKDAVIPLNKMAYDVLADWRDYSVGAAGFIFPARDGNRRKDTARAFMLVAARARIGNFSWHCLRHDFASQLAMEGVPLHIIQKLLCHGSITMTQRYAHLSPNSLEAAVKLLVH
ncbi:MAG: tyrosine-type recombinase/integrase [Synergistaceae bacterium]|nr:tyrosine-type recombinase/integrase [Synergistaceae bacterium]